MERSEIRGAARADPDCAALHPGYRPTSHLLIEHDADLFSFAPDCVTGHLGAGGRQGELFGESRAAGQIQRGTGGGTSCTVHATARLPNAMVAAS
jgi:hypothetical protein